MLRPGGYLLYSTCTFSTEEDEGTLKFILDNFPEMELVPVIREDDETYAGFARGIPAYMDNREEAAYALRIYPHRVAGEGHFVALLRKKDGNDRAELPHTGAFDTASTGECGTGAERTLFPNRYSEKIRKGRKIPDRAWDFLEKLGFEVPADSLTVRDGRLYMLPMELPPLDGLRILRSGLLLGEIKQDRFEPSQALACALKSDEYPLRTELDPDGQEVIKYLKCESIEADTTAGDGFVLVCCGRFPLGWGKLSGGRLKNKYLPGWRMM